MRKRPCTWRSSCTSLPPTRANTARCPCRRGGCRSPGKYERTAVAACCCLGGRATVRRSALRARTDSGRTLIEQTVRAHGGEASVDYRTDGLTCEIKLPLPEAARPSMDAAASKIATGPSLLAQPDNRRTLQGKRILVIEDEPLVAMDVESSLTAAGCEVVGPAATLERAKRLIEESDCDAALLDVNLAGQPVDELATLLTRKNRPFAFVTGYGRDALPSG